MSSSIPRTPVAVLLAALAVPMVAADSDMAPLPSEHPWSGASEQLALAPDESWATPFEASGQVASPDYAETMDWLERLAPGLLCFHKSYNW